MSLSSSKKECTLSLATTEFNLSSNKEERILKYFTPHMYTYIHIVPHHFAAIQHTSYYIYMIFIMKYYSYYFYCLLLSVYQVLENNVLPVLDATSAIIAEPPPTIILLLLLFIFQQKTAWIRIRRAYHSSKIISTNV